MLVKRKISVTIAIIFIVLLTALRISSVPLSNSDGFVNYYNTLKMLNGEKIWSEVNIITTPLLFYMGMIVLKIFGTKYIVYKIFYFVLNIVFFIELYKTFRNLNLTQKSSFIYAIVLYCINLYFTADLELTYNFLCLLICLIGLNLNLNKNKIKYFNLWQGLIIFLMFFTKQNIGFFYAISQIIIELLGNQKKTGIINLLKQFGVVFICGILFLIYLIKTNLLTSFIDMTILGMSYFSNNHYVKKYMVLITAILEISAIIMFFRKKYNQDKKEKLFILLVTATMQLFIIYPIADEWHTCIASMILYITVIYMINLNLDHDVILMYANIILIIFILSISIKDIIGLKTGIYEIETDVNSNFYLVNIIYKDRIENISEFIESKNRKVILITPEAGIFNVYNNFESHGFFDEPYNGNLGSNQLEKMIKKIAEYNEYYILIPQKKYLQEITEFREYIEQNYQKIGEIEDFSIYKK